MYSMAARESETAARGRGATTTYISDDQPMTAAQFESAVGMMMDRMADICAERERGVRAAVADGIKAGMRESSNDDELLKTFWRRGFEELAEHSQNGASQWLGRRLLTSAVVALTITCITWLVQSGRLK